MLFPPFQHGEGSVDQQDKDEQHDAGGNQPRLTSDLLSGIRTLTSGIVIEMGYAEGLHREALIAAGIVLFVFILLINASFSVLKRREQQ